MTDDGVSTGPDSSDRLGPGSQIEKALSALGRNGLRALGHLRDAQQRLAEPERWAQPYEGVQASLRSAIDALLKEAGREGFGGPEGAAKETYDRLGVFLRRFGKPSGPLERLLADLAGAGEVPQVLEPGAGLGAAVQRLVKVPVDRRPARAGFEAVGALLEVLEPLSALPAGAEEQRQLVEALEEVRRAGPAAGASEAGGEELAALRAAFEHWTSERNDRGGRRRRQIEHLIGQWTRENPGPGEAEAIRAWAVFYGRTSGVLHGSEESAGAAETRALFEQIVSHVGQLVLDLPGLAPELLRLVRVGVPTARDVEEAGRLQQRRAVRYFFQNAASPHWLDKDMLGVERLRPEKDRWPAEPYLQRMAAVDRERTLAWLTAERQAFAGVDPVVLAGLVRVAIAIGPASCELVRWVTEREECLEDLKHLLLVWLMEVPAERRDGAWVSVAARLLLHMLKAPRANLWEIQQGLVQLQAAGYPPGGGQASVVAGAVRSVLAKVLGASLAGEERHGRRLGDLDVVDDLRRVVVDDDHGPAVPRIAARAVLDYARTEALHGVELGRRIGQWVKHCGAGREMDRVRAVHLLEVAPAPDGEAAWLEQSRGVLARLGEVLRVTDDVADFVAAVVERCPGEARPGLEAALVGALGEAPDGAALAAGLDALARAEQGMVPPVWFTVYSIAPVLPAAVLAPWQPVVDGLSALFGPPERRPGPLFREVPFVDRITTAATELAAIVASAGVPAAAVELLARQRAGELSADYAYTVVRRLVTADPAAWGAAVAAVLAGLDDDLNLKCAYLGGLREQLAADPSRFHDPAAAARDTIGAVWELLPDAARAPREALLTLEMTLCRLTSGFWNISGDLGDLEPTVVGWLVNQVTGWTTPTRSQADPLRLTLNQVGGLALESLVHWGLARTGANGRLPQQAAGLLEALLGAEPDDRALAMIGLHLHDLLARDPAWVADHKELLLAVDEPWRPALVWLTHYSFHPLASIEIVRRLDPEQLAAYLCRPDSVREVMDTCAAVLLVEPEVLGGHQSFVDRLATGANGQKAVSALLRSVAWNLRQAAEDDVVALSEGAAAIWRIVLDLDVPDGTARHLVEAGDFAYAGGLDDNVWLELTEATVLRTPLVSMPDHVARRAAEHPHSPAARAILTHLLALTDHSVPNTVHDYRLEKVQQHGIALWKASAPGSPGREQLGQALAQHALFLEAAVE